MCSMRSFVTVLERRATPITRYPLESNNSARYEPSWPVIPVINAVGIHSPYFKIQPLNYKLTFTAVKRGQAWSSAHSIPPPACAQDRPPQPHNQCHHDGKR